MKISNFNDNLSVMEQNTGKAEKMLKQLANAKRLTILCHLMKHEHTVNEMAALVGLSKSAMSQHLAKMRSQQLVECEKRGQMVYYRIGSPEVVAILSTLYLIYCHE